MSHTRKRLDMPIGNNIVLNQIIKVDNIHKCHQDWTSDKNTISKHNEFKKENYSNNYYHKYSSLLNQNPTQVKRTYFACER